MTGPQRREQLLEVGRKLFADKGFEGTSVEEIAAKAGVSKPVVYEHFGGKEGLYAVVVDREIRTLLDGINVALRAETTSRGLLEAAALALLDYIEGSTDGFRILVRDSPAGQSTGSFASLISDVATQVEHLLGAEFKSREARPQDRSAVRADARRHGRPHRSVVAGLPQVQEGRRGGASGQPRVERLERPGTQAAAQRPALTVTAACDLPRRCRLKPRTTPWGSRG